MTKPHPFGAKRVPLETTYYEMFNLPHSHLVDVNETPIQEITSRGIKTSAEEYELDVIICATGFDAVSGGLSSLKIAGKNGVSIKSLWEEGIKTFMGISIPEFPNL